MSAGSDRADRRRGLWVAVAMTLAFHAALGGGLYAAGKLVDRTPRRSGPIEVEIVTPPPVVAEPEPPRIEEPEPEPPPAVTEPEPPRPVARKPRVSEPEPPRTTTPPPRPAAEAEADPAPGPADPAPPAPVVQLPDIGPGGTGPPAARGTPTTRKVGRGGTGTGTGGGAASGDGTGPAQPVSVASIKRRARPLSEVDTSGMYPAEARRLGVEGQIKVALVVDDTGRVVSKRLITRLGHGLDELAMTLADKLRFEPALDTNDRPVADRVVWVFTFVLPR